MNRTISRTIRPASPAEYTVTDATPARAALGRGCKLMGLVFSLVLLAGCAEKPPPEIKYISVPAPPVKPVIAAECTQADPADPYLANGTALAVVSHIEALKKQRAKFRLLRRVCRASLAANFGDAK